MKKTTKTNITLSLCLAGWLMPILPGQAASFDCGKAKTEIEKIICGNAELSRLDQVMADTYGTALKKSTNAEALKTRQRQWLKELSNCKTPSCIGGAYLARMNVLKDGDGAKYFETPHLQSPGAPVEVQIASVPDGYAISALSDSATYEYRLEMSQDDLVCKHMQQVYSQYFSQPWKIESFELNVYHEHSRYAFSRLPGVTQNNAYTFDMRYSKWPTSPEFEAIQWREGRYSAGGGPTLSPNEGLRYPLLVAEFDINNDGVNEQVFKDDFNPNSRKQYSLNILPKGTLDVNKPLTAWMYSRQKANISEDKFPLSEDVDVKVSSDPNIGRFAMSWAEVRPFILNGRSYLTIYDVWWIPLGSIQPDKKYMRVVELTNTEPLHIYNGPAALDEVREDMSGLKQICRFLMNPISNSK